MYHIRNQLQLFPFQNETTHLSVFCIIVSILITPCSVTVISKSCPIIITEIVISICSLCNCHAVAVCICKGVLFKLCSHIMCIIIQCLPGLTVLVCKINLIVGRVDCSIITDIFTVIVFINDSVYRNTVSIAVK